MIDVIGWIGTACVLAGFALVTKRGVSRLYQALNLAGAGALLANGWYHHALPSVGLNLAWLGIAAYGFGKLRK